MMTACKIRKSYRSGKLIARLRQGVIIMGFGPNQGEMVDIVSANQAMQEAADRLEALIEQHGKAMEALGIFADAIDEADNIIAINCGTDTPKEWDRAFKRCAKARAVLHSARQPVPDGDGEMTCSVGSCQRHGRCMYRNHPRCPNSKANNREEGDE